jgi:prepilin-type N-terminal cleavage/methylation domain-containing protein
MNMKKKKGFTLIELLVVIAIIAMLLAILMPALNKVKKIAMRVVCGTNLKGLGTAQNVYANDYNDQWTKQGSNPANTWGLFTPGWDDPAKDWKAATIQSMGTHLYLLVREADVSPKSFVCPASDQRAYDGKQDPSKTTNLDLVELWDFGNQVVSGLEDTGPRNCVSYSLQNPWGSRGASGTQSAQFAAMADKSPFFDNKLRDISDGGWGAETYMDYARFIGEYWDTAITVQKYEIQSANAHPHDRDGQNVLFADGHNEYTKESDVGIRHDNIYTYHNTAVMGSDPEDAIRKGIMASLSSVPSPLTGPAIMSSDPDNEVGITPVSSTDSVLLNDDYRQK